MREKKNALCVSVVNLAYERKRPANLDQEHWMCIFFFYFFSSC